MYNPESYISMLHLTRHPEGGWFRETYRAELLVEVPWASEKRSACTLIYYLLESGDFSSFHRIRSDESWHFYDGSSVEIYWFDIAGKLRQILLGKNVLSGEVLQCVVPAGCWFASRVKDPGTFSLVGCTVAPGFDFSDFELADRNEMIECYPEKKEFIISLTRKIQSSNQ